MAESPFRMKSLCRCIALAAACLAALGPVSRASAVTLSVPTEMEKGATVVTMEISSPLSETPPSGMFPLLVKINNSTTTPGRWEISTMGGAYMRNVSGHTTVEVAPGKTTSTWIYAPMATLDSSGGAYRQLRITVTGPKISGAMWNHIFSHAGGVSTATDDVAFPALSTGVSSKGEVYLQERYKTLRSSALDFTNINLDGEIGDWRGLSGIGQLWMTDDEWSSMSGGTRATLMDWMTLGGQVILLTRDDSETGLTARRVPAADAKGVRRVGMGKVTPLRWDGVTFPTNKAMEQMTAYSGGDLTHKILSTYDLDWTLPKTVGVFSIHGWLIFGFIVAFGVLVGPVNLFYFAGSRWRHRLFWTTPLISLSGGALLVVLMLLQDGVGGSGARRILAILAPDQKKTAIVQEQVTRTGVLLSSSFTVPEAAWMRQLALDDSGPMNPLGDRGRSLSEEGDLRSGEWFASRSVQGHVLETVRPSRGGIEFYPGANGGVPSVVSSLAAPLKELYIVDDQGKFWKGEDFAAGERKPLVSCTSSELREWVQRHAEQEMGPLAKKLVERTRGQQEYVYAVSDNAEAFAIPTLKSVRWNNQSVFFTGHYEKR